MKPPRPLVLLGAAMLVLCALPVRPAVAQANAEECQIVAQLDAERWRAYRESLRTNFPRQDFYHYIDAELAGMPSGWPKKADDTLWTRFRLWLTSRGPVTVSPLVCRPDFKSMGLLVDLGPGGRAKAFEAAEEVVDYSRVQMALGGRWAIVSKRTCIPSRTNGPMDEVSTLLLAKSGTAWSPVASSSSGPQIALARYKSKPSYCTRAERRLKVR